MTMQLGSIGDVRPWLDGTALPPFEPALD